MGNNILLKGASKDMAGDIVSVGNKKYICAYTAITSLAAGVPVIIVAGPDLTTAYTPVAIAAATVAIPGTLVGITDFAIAAAGWYWFQIKGLATAYVLGASGIVVGAGLKLTNGGTNFVVDASTGVPATSTMAINQAIYTTTSAALKSVYLTGKGGQI